MDKKKRGIPMKIYAYVRISTPKQSIERQIRNIQFIYPNAIIVKEIYTRTSFQGRKEWDKLMRVVQSEDKIVFDSVSRMSGNADEGCEIYETLFNNGIILEFIKEPHINTEVYKQALQNQVEIKLNTGNKATDDFIESIIESLNKYTIDLAKAQIRIAFEQAEKEVSDLHQRTKEGIETARLNGKQIGRKRGTSFETKKSKEAKEKIRKYNKSFGGPLTNEETWKFIGISKTSFYKYKEELLTEVQ